MYFDDKDTLRLKHALSKRVVLETEDGESHEGWLKTIDPVTGNLVLVTFNEGKVKTVEIIMGHAYDSAEVKQDGDAHMKSMLDDLFCGRVPEPLIDLPKRKSQLTSWLLKNRIPVKEDSDNSEVISVAGALSIHPPYGIEQCISTNEVILGKIQNLVLTVPNENC